LEGCCFFATCHAGALSELKNAISMESFVAILQGIEKAIKDCCSIGLWSPT
jgi:hypothetical protein